MQVSEEVFMPPVIERDSTVSQPIDKRFYMDVDEVAEFPGGRAAMKSFLDANIKNPDPAIEGICFLRFVVTEDGARIITRITLGVPNCPECDKEALRVVKMMPKWEAGKIGGKKVKSYVDLPIYFKQ